MIALRTLRRLIGADPRLGRILSGGFSGLLGRGAGLLISAITLPLTLRYLGPMRYGIWVTISSTVVMLSVMDLGIANTLTNLISKAYALDDRAMARRYYSTAFWISVGISLTVGAAAALLWPQVNWGSLFHLQNPAEIREVSACVATVLGYFLLSLPLNLVNRVLSGYQRTEITNYFNVLSNLLGLVAIVAAIAVHASLLGLMLMYSCSLLTGSVILNVWVNFWDRRWILPLPQNACRLAARDIFSSGLGFLILQIAGLVVYNSDNLIITHYLGASEVTPYSVTWRLAGYAAVLQAAVFPSLWPAYSEAYARRDYTWVRKTFWRAVKVVMGSVAAAVLVLMICGQSLIRWYVGPAAVPGTLLLYAICGWSLLNAAMDLESCLLAAVNRVRLQGVLGLIAAGLNIALSIFLVKRIGSLGVVLGTILSYLLTVVVPQTVIVWRTLYHPEPISRNTVAEVAEHA